MSQRVEKAHRGFRGSPQGFVDFGVWSVGRGDGEADTGLSDDSDSADTVKASFSALSALKGGGGGQNGFWFGK